MPNLMELTYRLRLLKDKLIIAVVFLLLGFTLRAQQLTKLKSITIESSPQSVSIDKQGNFYLATAKGDIDKYDNTGELRYHFSPPKSGIPSLIEAWQGLRVFCYYQDFQDYLFLNRFLTNSERFALPNRNTSYSSLVTISGDNNLWLMDAQELSLRKIDLPSNEIISDTPFSLNLEQANYEFQHIRDYQNRLFISDKENGILMFDRFGNFLELLRIEGVGYFSFNKNELLYLQNGVVKLIDIYTKKEREIDLLDPSYKFVLMENSLLFCFADNKIDLYQIN